MLKFLSRKDILLGLGYILVAIALAAGATKGFCGKKTSGYVVQTKDAMFVNFIRMLFCIVIGFGMLAFGGKTSLLAIDAKTFGITLFFRRFYCIFCGKLASGNQTRCIYDC